MRIDSVQTAMSGARTRGLRLLAVVLVGLIVSACSGGGDGGGGESEVRAGGGGEEAVADDGKRRQLNSGQNGPPTAGEIVATSMEEWREKWLAAGATVPPPAVNDVDFETEVVVGIFGGERPSGGWKIDPNVDVKVQGVFAAVIYEVVGPGEGCQTSQALTAPYLVLAVKAKSVRFESTERTEPCE